MYNLLHHNRRLRKRAKSLSTSSIIHLRKTPVLWRFNRARVAADCQKRICRPHPELTIGAAAAATPKQGALLRRCRQTVAARSSVTTTTLWRPTTSSTTLDRGAVVEQKIGEYQPGAPECWYTQENSTLSPAARKRELSNSLKGSSPHEEWWFTRLEPTTRFTHAAAESFRLMTTIKYD